MKREEKNQQSRSKIMESALREFSAQGYGLSSVNTICETGGISKGILYHYFKDKDELYLSCVRQCFDALTAYLREKMPFAAESADAQEQLQAYFDARLTFFQENQTYQRLFCEAIVAPPRQLSASILNIREGFDTLNLEILGGLLESVILRPDVTRAEVLSLLGQYQDFINANYQRGGMDGMDAASREEACRRALSILLYGVVTR